MKKDGTAFLLGAAGYPAVEICWRGHTHWTMALAGGICLVLLCRHQPRLAGRPVWMRCAVGAGLITAVELLFGLVCNRALRWAVWDYSHLPLNLWGQVCLPFFLLWAGMCALLQPVLNFLCAGGGAKRTQP